MSKRYVEIDLTPEQQADIWPIIERAKKASRNARPGMILAQVYSTRMIVGFIGNKRAKAVQSVWGSNGKTFTEIIG